MSEAYAQFPPTPAWTDHERMLVLYRIAGQMQRESQRALLPDRPHALAPEVVYSWGERIKFVISMDREWLELHRHELLVGLEPLTTATEV